MGLWPIVSILPTPPFFYRRGPTNRASFLPHTAHSGTSGFLFYHQPLPYETEAIGYSLRREGLVFGGGYVCFGHPPWLKERNPVASAVRRSRYRSTTVALPRLTAVKLRSRLFCSVVIATTARLSSLTAC